MDRLAGGDRIGDWACMSACRDVCTSTEGYMVTGDCAWAKDGVFAWMGVGLWILVGVMLVNEPHTREASGDNDWGEDAGRRNRPEGQRMGELDIKSLATSILHLIENVITVWYAIEKRIKKI